MSEKIRNILLAAIVALVTVVGVVTSHYKGDPKVCTIFESDDFSDNPFVDRISFIKNKLWRKDTITIFFMNGSEDLINRIFKSGTEWSQYSSLVFKRVSSTPADVRIRLSSAGGGWSYLGTDATYITQSAPTMELGLLNYSGNATEINRVTKHEFGHMIGAIHEHQNPSAGIPWNAPVVYAYYARYGWDKRTVDQNIFRKYTYNETNSSNFDSKSIMLYAIPASLTTNGFSVNWNNQLSTIDKEWVATVYPKKIVDPKPVDTCVYVKVTIRKDTIIQRDSIYCKDTIIYK